MKNIYTKIVNFSAEEEISFIIRYEFMSAPNHVDAFGDVDIVAELWNNHEFYNIILKIVDEKYI